MAASICVKLLNTKVDPSEEWKSILVRLLKTAGNPKSLKVLIAFLSVADDADHLLTTLSTYLSNPDLEIASGAAKIASELVEGLSQAHISVSRRNLLQKPYFDLMHAQRLIQSEEKDQRIDGIWLLTLSDLRGASDGAWLLEEIRHCASPNEAKAWAAFLRGMRQEGDETESKWKGLLESILESPRGFPREVSLAALERYEGLVRLWQPGIILDERELGLPLDWESRRPIVQTATHRNTARIRPI
jgi:hypothetical protein